MSKTTAFAAAIVAMFAIAASASAGTEYHLGKYADLPPGSAALQYKADHAGYLTYTGSTEQAKDKGVRYLTYTGSTEQPAQVKPEYRTSTGAPQGMSPTQWERDLLRAADGNAANAAAELRGEALNNAYGNAWTKMSSQQFAALVDMFGTNVTQYSPKQLQALLAQGSASSGGGFGWGDAGIGAVAAIGLMLVAGIVRRIRRTPRFATA